jgi:hypothetical protein
MYKNIQQTMMLGSTSIAALDLRAQASINTAHESAATAAVVAGMFSAAYSRLQSSSAVQHDKRVPANFCFGLQDGAG